MRFTQTSGNVLAIMPGAEIPGKTGLAGRPAKKLYLLLVFKPRCRGAELVGENAGLDGNWEGAGILFPRLTCPRKGKVRVPAELRAELTDGGFEVGIQDLKHDGHLFACTGIQTGRREN